MPQPGELNHRAELSNDEVELMRDLYEQDEHKPKGERFWTTKQLAEKFDTSVRNVQYIVRYSRRT